ncbi:MAG: hypothetical protein N4A72_03835 [Bacteroidales bacterium]|jgi:hypothetical protein|nr:hypothetical protein [Bacteroidales bacterium]
MKKALKPVQFYSIKFSIFYSIIICLLIVSCDSGNKDPLIGIKWKLKEFETEIKVNGKFEKIDSFVNPNILFDKITFQNNTDFKYKTKGFTVEDNNATHSFTGGTGFYERQDEKIVLKFMGNQLSYDIMLDTVNLVLINENLLNGDSLILSSENRPEIIVKGIRTTFRYVK